MQSTPENVRIHEEAEPGKKKVKKRKPLTQQQMLATGERGGPSLVAENGHSDSS